MRDLTAWARAQPLGRRSCALRAGSLERRYYPAVEDAMMRAERPDLSRSSNLANRRAMSSEVPILADLRARLARLQADG